MLAVKRPEKLLAHARMPQPMAHKEDGKRYPAMVRGGQASIHKNLAHKLCRVPISGGLQTKGLHE